MDSAEKLRSKRKELVVAAKSAIQTAFEGQQAGVNKAQLSHLIGVCNEAACVEEIELYIRYQASREKSEGEGRRKNKGGVWDEKLAKSVIEQVNAVISPLGTDELKVAAWRLYAVYLTREFTYQKAARGVDDNNHDEDRTPQVLGHHKAPEGRGPGQQHGRGGRR